MAIQAVAENQPVNKNRDDSELSIFAARVRDHIGFWADDFSLGDEVANDPAYRQHADIEFSGMAVMLFTLQYKHNAPYRRLCEARGLKPGRRDALDADSAAVPTAAFKELDLTCLHPEDRTQVFHSSGTTEQRPSRHHHSAESLALYEASLWPWFVENLRLPIVDGRLLSLTPPRPKCRGRRWFTCLISFARRSARRQPIFSVSVGADGSWTLDV
jgi:hypothetical protein